MELPGSLECKYLARLNLDSCENLGDAAIKKIVKVAPNLRLLYLGNCRNLTNDAVHAICKLGRNLLSIDLSRCSQITDVAIKELAQDCSDIREIYLRGSTQLTDESVTCLAALQELRTIILDDCHITCKSILALAGCNSFEDLPKHRERSLQWVSLNGCDRVTLQVSSSAVESVAASSSNSETEYCMAIEIRPRALQTRIERSSRVR